jgi:hypothetical protein
LISLAFALYLTKLLYLLLTQEFIMLKTTEVKSWKKDGKTYYHDTADAEDRTRIFYFDNTLNSPGHCFSRTAIYPVQFNLNLGKGDRIYHSLGELLAAISSKFREGSIPREDYFNTLKNATYAMATQNEGIYNALRSLDGYTLVYGVASAFDGVGEDGAGANLLGLAWTDTLNRIKSERRPDFINRVDNGESYLNAGVDPANLFVPFGQRAENVDSFTLAPSIDPTGNQRSFMDHLRGEKFRVDQTPDGTHFTATKILKDNKSVYLHVYPVNDGSCKVNIPAVTDVKDYQKTIEALFTEFKNFYLPDKCEVKMTLHPQPKGISEADRKKICKDIATRLGDIKVDFVDPQPPGFLPGNQTQPPAVPNPIPPANPPSPALGL